MFERAARDERRLRAGAFACLGTVDKVWNVRRDQMDPEDEASVRGLRARLKGLLKARSGAAEIGAATEALDAALRRSGGAAYPATALVENVEFLVILVFVVIGFRGYFVQNFEIPTNSMWPTYQGMTPEVFSSPADEPGSLREAARILTVGAWPHRIDAPADGEVLIPIGGSDSAGYVHSAPVSGRSLLVFPSKQREYTLLVGGRPVRGRVPEDFDLDWAVYDGFLGGGAYSPARLAAGIRAKFEAGEAEDRLVDGEWLHCVRTGRSVRAGERLFAFDEIAGDKVFVDRFSYNFVRPAIGSGLVFRTGRIPEIARRKGDIFFIKRLVGQPGDTLEVKGSALLRNGAPITGSAVFDANARRLGNYPGYEARGLLRPGSTVRVEPGAFFAMGDNSPNSEDGRMWGFVPAKDVVGRPLGMYYPLVRLGPAR